MRHLLVVAIATVILFVVVCPLTPTPTAVVSGKAHLPQMQAMVVTVACLFAVFALKQLTYAPQSDYVVIRDSFEVLDVTCVQIC